MITTEIDHDVKQIQLVIADDHPLVREGVKKVLERSGENITVVQEASDAGELMEVLATTVPDLVILDITMPGQNGLDTLKDIKETYANLPVLMLSMHPEDRFALRTLRAGAAGYLNKESVSTKLVTAIKHIVIDKKRFISPSVAEEMADHLDDNGKKQPHQLLSDREYQVLCLIASGKKVKEIAAELELSNHTIHTYRSRVMKKMDLSTNVELTHYALKHNLID
ncbi:MAG: response regulator transcription factor [Candidatus Marinimicrobia bacterium]|nr:response regulator transcription factor [Candidatus Neomarinimicrobiota bacterium]